MQRWVMLMAGLLATWSAFAEWTGEGELGLVLARGNSDNETVNARLKLVWEREQWVNETILSAVHSSESDETTASRYVLSNKTDYTLNKTSYLAGVVRYDRDRFSGFRFQSSAAVAYGRRLIDSEAHRLRVEIGPGLKYAESRATGESTSEAMLRGYTQYTWVMSTTANLTIVCWLRRPRTTLSPKTNWPWKWLSTIAWRSRQAWRCGTIPMLTPVAKRPTH